MTDSAQPWWTGAVGYQAYIRSFADSTGSGIGDLRGIHDQLDHLEWLGVDAVWINPFNPSPGHDHGYDVADYVDVDPQHGTLADFDDLVAEATRRGIRVIVDIVPNHTSNEHAWFEAAVSDPTGPYRDYYIWRDPAPDAGPPNNWVSHFGGPAWTLDPESGQYYCHMFLPEQPDLNWRNPAVADEFEAILRFWFERGASGFRIDVAHGCTKDPELRDNPQIRPVDDSMSPRAIFDSYDHLHDLDQDENVAIFRRWNKIAAEYGAVLIGEIGADQVERASRYVTNGDALHQLFFLRSTWAEWVPSEWIDAITSMQTITTTGVSWALSCHDRPRPVTRFMNDGADLGRARERAFSLTTLFMALGGMPFLYQGEALGLADGTVDPSSMSDPLAARHLEWAHEGRDGCRTPMPWDTGANNGFSTGTPWLLSDPRPESETVAGQRADSKALVHRYRDLIAFRHRSPQLWDGDASTADLGSNVLTIERPNSFAVCNLGSVEAEVELPDGDWILGFSSTDGSADQPATSIARIDAESTHLYLR
jgi:alpha-glucosidase